MTAGHGPRRHWLRIAATVAVLGALAGILTAGWDTLARSVAGLAGLDFRWFALGVIFEAVSLSAFGLSRRRLLRADGHRADFRSVMAITYAGNALSIAVPLAGPQLALVFSYRQFRRRGVDPALTGWALAVSGIASASALALLLVAGALLAGRPLATAVGFVVAAAFGLPGLTAILALRYPWARAAANRALTWLVHLARRLLRKTGTGPASPEAFLTRVGGIRLGGLGSATVSGFALVNWLADCACLGCAILAASGALPWHALILAYGVGAAAGSTGLTPGGFALVEIALTAALVAAGLAPTTAITAVLAYRLLNFWLILLGGTVAMLVLTHAREHRISRYDRPPPAGRPGRIARPERQRA